MTRLLFLAASALVLPLALLLFAQWPLRELVQAYSTQANDAAQILFALYMAVAVTAATREGLHLSAGHAPDEHARPAGRWRAWALLICTGPWVLFLLWASAPAVWQSVRQFERFGETFNAGYYLVKLALWLLAVLILIEAVGSAVKRRSRP
jgi:TRAP-type C4-dicarboxylate transport system permease small subunit